jgi:hypothetical protein
MILSYLGWVWRENGDEREWKGTLKLQTLEGEKLLGLNFKYLSHEVQS